MSKWSRRLTGLLLFFSIVGRLNAMDDTDTEGWFREVAKERGIQFIHQDARSGQKYYIETAASGGGWLDYDGDGDLDLYLLNGAVTPGSSISKVPRNSLYENRAGSFIDVTDRAGVGDENFSMGLCVGDYDSDGNLDFLVTNYGKDRLYKNLGNGTFKDVAVEAGVDDLNWGTSCSFTDIDVDGDLDLYVARYVDFSYKKNPYCGDLAREIRTYCRPDMFAGVTDSLFVNQGNGVFREEGKIRGIVQDPSSEKGFGVIFSDFDKDGDPDLYVANDGTPNRFYVNDGRGFFKDFSLLSGTALSDEGEAESGMGVDVGDFDADGLNDLIVTNYSFETNTLYKNLGDLFFDDRTISAGLAELSHRPVGWGIQFFDYDNDGDLDLAVANGHVMDNIDLFESEATYPQSNQLLENDGKGYFRDVSVRAGVPWEVRKVSRGLAVGDWNDDGRLDLLITNTNDVVDVLENQLVNGNRWLGVVLRGPRSNHFAIGARVDLRAGDIFTTREIRSGGSFLAQSDLRLHFGLGLFQGTVFMTIYWPDGKVQTEKTDQLNKYMEIMYRPREVLDRRK